MSIARPCRVLVFLAVLAPALDPPGLLAHEPDADERALASLVDADFAFAREASERGGRAASFSHFSADAVLLAPEPLRQQHAWTAPSAVAEPTAQTRWTPAQAGVARSHDLGFTTGPYTQRPASATGEAQHGVYFFVWARNREGAWQVVLHAQMRTPGPVDFVSLGAAPRADFRQSSSASRERRTLLALEADAFGCGSHVVTPTCYAQRLSDDVRLYRQGESPLASRSAVAPEVARRVLWVAWSPTGARVASSADMAVSYGRYRASDRASRAQEGHYVHLWLRDRAGRWRLAYDLALPVGH